MVTTLTALLAVIRARVKVLLADQRGYTTESVVVTAVLAAGAILVLGIVVGKVVARARGLYLGP